MFILITGGNDSGKSNCAERIASRFSTRKIYVATMIPFGAEGETRKAKHLLRRAGMNFFTVECPYDLGEVKCESCDLVLLEDVSNLLANLTFGQKIPDAADVTFEQIIALAERCEIFIAVSISKFDLAGCDEKTRDYAASLAALNGRLAEKADIVAEMRARKPFFLKGEFPWPL